MKSSFNTTTHNHTHKRASARAFETKEAIKNLPTHNKAHIGLPQIYTSLLPSKMPSVEKVLGVMKQLLRN
jgi:hypothetical protein